MYSIYDKASAVLQVQRLLSAIGDKKIFVAPSGVYDENTRLSVLSFQKDNKLAPTGVVDSKTFNLLYERFSEFMEKKEIERSLDYPITFPIFPGSRERGMAHINRLLSSLMYYYGFAHNLQESSNYYTVETARAVRVMRKVYLLDSKDLIDEEFYRRIFVDADSIEKAEKLSSGIE